MAIPIRDIRYPPNPRNQELLQEAAAKFQQQFKTETGDPARIIEGPWYATTTEGEILLENGRMMRPSHIYYAILDVR